jgi:UDPglucose 6-dehydrogenase
LCAVIEVNNHQRQLFFKKVKRELKRLKGRRIAVWGLAFKNNTDDVRESASLDIVRWLVGHGAEVVAYDPEAMENAKKELPEAVQYAPTAMDAAQGVDALLVLTEWPQFTEVSFTTLKMKMLEPRIFDGRNVLKDLKLKDKGFDYHGVGIGSYE